MATTTNYSWTTPDDTDLVKDGASAIRSLGTAIDTTVFNNASAAIAKTIVDAKGDLIVGTADDTVARLASSASNGDLLTVDTSTASGLKWAAPAAGGANWSLLNSGGTSLTGATTITVSGISGKDKIMILMEFASSVNSSAFFGVRLNTDTGSNYTVHGIENEITSSYSNNNFYNISLTNDWIPLARLGGSATQTASGYCLLSGCNSSGVKVFNAAGSGGQSSANQKQFILGGFYNSSSTISSISLFSTSGNFDAGTVYVYTSA